MDNTVKISGLLQQIDDYIYEHCCVDAFFHDGLWLALKIAKKAENGEHIDIEKMAKEATECAF